MSEEQEHYRVRLDKLRELTTLSVEQRLVAALCRMASHDSFLREDGRIELCLDVGHANIVAGSVTGADLAENTKVPNADKLDGKDSTDFVRDVVAGKTPSPSFEEGLMVQRVLDAVERSSNDSSRWTLVETRP